MLNTQDLNVPFEFLIAELPLDSSEKLSTSAKLLWFYLINLLRNNAQQGIFKYPDLSELAEATKLSRGRISQMITALEKCGYVETKKNNSARILFERVKDPMDLLARTKSDCSKDLYDGRV